MKKFAIATLVVLALGLSASVIFASTIYSTKMTDFQVKEPVEIAGVLTQLECPAVCIYSPGQRIANGTYEVKNIGSLDYGLRSSVALDNPGYEPPTFIVLARVGDSVFRSGDIIPVKALVSMVIEVEIWVAPDSPAGSATNPHLQWERTYPPGCASQECG